MGDHRRYEAWPSLHRPIRHGFGVEDFRGCRFDGIHTREFPIGGPPIRGAAVCRADSTQDRMVVWEKDILDIVPEENPTKRPRRFSWLWGTGLLDESVGDAFLVSERPHTGFAAHSLTWPGSSVTC